MERAVELLRVGIVDFPERSGSTDEKVAMRGVTIDPGLFSANGGTIFMSANTPQPPPGWFPDQTDSQQMRWWDGQAWTSRTQPNPALTADGSEADIVAPDPGAESQASSMAGSDPRKPWYFRWWAITAAVLVALSIFGNLLPDDNQAKPTSSAADASSTDEPSSDPTKSAEELEAERREAARQEREEKRAEAQRRREERAAAE